jgi:CrcB protein
LRYLAGHLIDGQLPRGTLAVNLVGSLLLGWFSGLGIDGDPMALLGTGFCGGLTTYSSFVVHSYDRGTRVGTLNVVLTVVPALLLCFVGFWVGAAQA